MTLASCDISVAEQAYKILREAGNPFRNYFARNPDDEMCALFHVPELFARERSQLLGAVDLFRGDQKMHSEVVPVLGNKGAGKTHLLHSIKHGQEGAWRLLVNPGTYQKDSDFLEYLLFQIIDTLLGGGKQKGKRPLEVISEELTRQLLHRALSTATRDEQMDLFPAPGLGRWTRRLGLGSGQAQERTQWLIDSLTRPVTSGFAPLRRLCAECNLDTQRACAFLCQHIEKTEGHATQGLMRRHIFQGFARAALLGDESDLAGFLTYGFAELDFKVRPSRQDLVLALFKVLMESLASLKIPVVVAFDQLEDLLLVRRNEDGHRVAEAFFAGIVQTMHQIDGLCFLVFAERGLWNRFIPSLDGYIQDRLSNPIHVPGHGTIKALRLEAPPPDLVRRVVEARLRPTLTPPPSPPGGEGRVRGETKGTRELLQGLPEIFPFTDDQINQIARTEPTLRDMLQQFRQLFDHLVSGSETGGGTQESGIRGQEARINEQKGNSGLNRDQESPGSTQYSVPSTQYSNPTPPPPLAPIQTPRITHHATMANVKSVVVVQTSADQPLQKPVSQLSESWDQEIQAARRKLEPEGALTGATRELQAGLGAFLQLCHDHGVKVGPWRLQHVVPEWTFGSHPTYGVITIAHWACKDGQPWKVGIGWFLGRGAGKPKDLEIKLSSLEAAPPMIDHLILLRPEDDLALTGKSKTLWQETERRGLHARLEPVNLAGFATIYAFSRWLATLSEGLPPGESLPNLADFLQERCDKLLEQVCMPVSP